jgi:alpha-tubulin suppressor-like RCC1 family protein
MVGVLLVFWAGTSPIQAQEATTGQAGVMAWGHNGYGQLGNGTTTEFSTTPVQVSGLSGVQDIAGGAEHTLALKDDGTVWAWGSNHLGQLGDATNPDYSNTPVQVSGFSGVQAIAAGSYHSLALKNDGTVWAWGWNEYGQLGDATNTDSNTPVQVSGLSGVQDIAGGGGHSLALPSPTGPQTKADCKNGGYENFGFKNQGECIKAVNATN